MKWSKIIFFSTIVGAVYRDTFTNDSGIELYIGVIMGMSTALVTHMLFERKPHDTLKQKQNNAN